MIIEGRCACGFVRYRASGPLSNQTICHCETCRRTSGAPMVAWVSVPVASYEVTAGEPASFRSSEHGTRTFCPRCGTALTFFSDNFAGDLDITICSLDRPDDVVPQDHVFVRSKLSWVALDGKPTYDELRTS